MVNKIYPAWIETNGVAVSETRGTRACIIYLLSVSYAFFKGSTLYSPIGNDNFRLNLARNLSLNADLAIQINHVANGCPSLMRKRAVDEPM